jgi:hypothetical protein
MAMMAYMYAEGQKQRLWESEYSFPFLSSDTA